MARKLSVVICTHNRSGLLQGTVESLCRQDGIESADYEIVIIDDGSTDDTGERIGNLRLPVELRYFYKDWGGRSEARNTGIEKAGGKIILFVDDDILAPPSFIANHIRHYAKPGRIVVRGPIVNVSEYRQIPDFKPGMAYYSGAFFCTCNASARKKDLMDVGGFDTDFREYGFEDNELGWRLREAGCRVEFDMDAFLFHYKPVQGRETGESLDDMEKRAGELGRSAGMYLKKHPHWKVRMAVGMDPFNYIYSSMFNNRFFHDAGVRLIESGKLNKLPLLHSFFSGRIYWHVYFENLCNSMKK